MQLYFIRHGQSENNILWERENYNQLRYDDPALSELGKKQAQCIAKALADAAQRSADEEKETHYTHKFGITHIYTSLMIRAIDTGTAIATALGLPLVVWMDLHESGGIFKENPQSGELIGQPGKTRDYFEAHYPNLQIPEPFDAGGWWQRPFEPREARPARARQVLTELLARHGNTDNHVVLVSHGGFYNYLIRAILKLPAEQPLWLDVQNTSISRIDFLPEETKIVYSNRVNFLPHDLVS